ncbi:serine protease [Seongchinamella sediminis]|uniref:Serine protease n=1 Tax=Seongchinamella sediminis TaxID=2283635 RepID=A0A3L7DWW9_9GAMM|nr:serine protease [Seongchinamella sediminis]RLQ20733.1 serine protease [Seongchinamella sediminis]
MKRGLLRTRVKQIGLGAVLLLWGLTIPAALGSSFPDVIDRVRPGVVGVGTAYPPRQPNRKGDAVNYRGTGFVVGNGRQVITNAHVIPDKLDTDNMQTLAVFAGRGASARAHTAAVVTIDKAHDLALLTIQAGPLPALELGDSSRVREGQEVAVTGFPIGMVLGLYPVTHRGIVASITPIARPVENARSLNAAQIARLRNNRFDAFQLDVIAYPGNSGSPVYEASTGKVIGVINSVFVKESKESMLERPSGISYAIPVSHVRALLRAGDAGAR